MRRQHWAQHPAHGVSSGPRGGVLSAHGVSSSPPEGRIAYILPTRQHTSVGDRSAWGYRHYCPYTRRPHSGVGAHPPPTHIVPTATSRRCPNFGHASPSARRCPPPQPPLRSRPRPPFQGKVAAAAARARKARRNGRAGRGRGGVISPPRSTPHPAAHPPPHPPPSPRRGGWGVRWGGEVRPPVPPSPRPLTTHAPRPTTHAPRPTTHAPPYPVPMCSPRQVPMPLATATLSPYP